MQPCGVVCETDGLLCIYSPQTLFQTEQLLGLRYHVINRTTLRGEVEEGTAGPREGRVNGAIWHVNEPRWAMASGSEFFAKDG